MLVDALVRFFASVHTWPSSHGNADSSSSGVTPAAADLRTARGWARAWVLVMQWVSTSAPRGDARGALSRLAEVATQLLCWPPPDHASSSGPSDGPESSGSSSDGVDSAAHSGGGGGSYTVGDSSQLASPLRVSTPHIGGGAAFDRFEAAGASDDAADESVSVVAAEAAAVGANLDYVCQHQAFLAGRDYLSQVLLIGSVCPRRLGVELAAWSSCFTVVVPSSSHACHSLTSSTLHTHTGCRRCCRAWISCCPAAQLVVVSPTGKRRRMQLWHSNRLEPC